VVKNKVAPPFTEAEFDIMYNEGISSVGALLDVALEQQVIEKRGFLAELQRDAACTGPGRCEGNFEERQGALRRNRGARQIEAGRREKLMS